MNLQNEKLAIIRRQKTIYNSEIERIRNTTNDQDKINRLNAKITILDDEEQKILKELW